MPTDHEVKNRHVCAWIDGEWKEVSVKTITDFEWEELPIEKWSDLTPLEFDHPLVFKLHGKTHVTAKRFKKWLMSLGCPRNDADLICRFLNRCRCRISYAELYNDVGLRLSIMGLDPKYMGYALIAYLLK